jgi:hypothetical protein
MGGRKRRGGRMGHPSRKRCFSRVVAALEELFTATVEEVSRRRNRGQGRP